MTYGAPIAFEMGVDAATAAVNWSAETVRTISDRSANIRKVDLDGWHNFVNKLEVLPEQTIKYSARIITSKSNQIMIGFCTKSGLGNIDNYFNAESAYYFCYGLLYKNGISKCRYEVTGAGCVVECWADLLGQKMRWRSGGR